jgi:hypothetical protein
MQGSLVSSGAWLCFLIAASQSPSAWGREAFTACETPESLRTSIDTPEKQPPESCRRFSITRAEGPTGDLCRVEITTQSAGLFEAIAAPAIPEQWWVRCTDLAPTRGR